MPTPLGIMVWTKNHYSEDIIVNKIIEEDKKISLQQAVNMAVWTHNTNINWLGFDPLTLVTGKAVVFPGIKDGDIASKSFYDSEAVRKIMERHTKIAKWFREPEYEDRLQRAQ